MASRLTVLILKQIADGDAGGGGVAIGAPLVDGHPESASKVERNTGEGDVGLSSALNQPIDLKDIAMPGVALVMVVVAEELLNCRCYRQSPYR